MFTQPSRIEALSIEYLSSQKEIKASPLKEETSLPKMPVVGIQEETDSLRASSIKVKGVTVRGGEKGRGSPCMSVLSLREHFKNISKSEILKNFNDNTSSSPEKKLNTQNNDFLSPSKKMRTVEARIFWISLDEQEKQKLSRGGN